MGITFTAGQTLMDGTEQTLWDTTADNHFAAHIFLDTMASGDTVEVRVYVYDEQDTTMRLEDLVTLTGVQASPAYYIPFITTKEYKVTLKQTAGTNRTYSWQKIQVT